MSFSAKPGNSAVILSRSVSDLDVGAAASSTEQPFLAEWCKPEPTRKVLEQPIHFTVEH